MARRSTRGLEMPIEAIEVGAIPTDDQLLRHAEEVVRLLEAGRWVHLNVKVKVADVGMVPHSIMACKFEGQYLLLDINGRECFKPKYGYYGKFADYIQLALGAPLSLPAEVRVQEHKEANSYATRANIPGGGCSQYVTWWQFYMKGVPPPPVGGGGERTRKRKRADEEGA